VPRLTILLGATLLAFATPGATAFAATPVGDAVAGLRADHLFIDPQATTKLDQAAIRAAIGDAPIRIAILPAGAGVSTVREWPRMISAQLPGNTVAVISGRYFYAGSDLLASGVAGLAATHAIAKHKNVLRENASSDVTAALLDFVAEVKAAPLAAPTAGRDARSSRYADQPGGGSADDSEDTGILPWVIGGAVLAVLAAAGGTLEARRRAASRSRGRRTETYELLDRLAAELDPGLPGGGAADGPASGAAEDRGGTADRSNTTENGGVVRGQRGGPATGRDGGGVPDRAARAAEALADASARHATAQALLTAATTARQIDQARHVILEGLTAARGARTLLGKDAGAAVPAFDPPPPKVRADSPEPIAVGASRLSPDPEYAPETPYYHPGGYGVPAGWYAARIPGTGAFTVPDKLPAEPTGVSHGER
jgi:hypothetical protein